jgi:hypothetical protein
VYSYREYYGATNMNWGVRLRLDNISSPNNWIMCQWQISGETSSHSDWGFYVLRNGSYIPRGAGGSGPGEGNYGTGQYWMHHQGGGYDGEDGSTPMTMCFTYIGRAGLTGSVEYALRMNNSAGSDYTFYSNRTVGSAGQNNYENGVSLGIIYEISGDAGASTLSSL